MPAEIWHRNKNSHDLVVSSFLRTRNPEFVDWEVTTIFYAAVQLVDAFIARTDPANFPSQHRERNTWIRLNQKSAYATYMNLYLLSQAARYDTTMSESDREDAMSYYCSLWPFFR